MIRLKKAIRIVSLMLMVAVLLSGCGAAPTDTVSATEATTDVSSAEGKTTVPSSAETTVQQPKQSDNSKPTQPAAHTTPADSSADELSAADLSQIHAIYSKAPLGPQTVTTVHQLAILTSVCASIDGAGPITVTPAVLNREPITLVTLGGTQIAEGQATTMEESRLASFGKDNDYLTAVISLIQNHTIPSNKPILVTGISLGGMIAQQLLGQQELLRAHHIAVRGVICFGSPLTPPIERYGVPVIRFTDKHDMVPEMGEMAIYSALPQAKDRTKFVKDIQDRNAAEKIIRTGAHTSPIEAHALSYISDPCWNNVDFFGSPKKENVLVLKDKLTFYPAPKLK